MSAAGIRRLIGTAAWIALGSAVWWAYAPSLGQMPRSDHWWYLIDTSGRDDFAELVSHTYSWNRTRRDLMAGDTALFRPVLFTVLAAEKAWLDPRQELVQSIGVVLHLGISGLLHAVLRR